MKLILSYSGIKKVKRRGKSEFYGLAFTSDRGQAIDEPSVIDEHIRRVVGSGSLTPDLGSGVRMAVTPTFEGIRSGESVNLAGIGLPFYSGGSGGEVAAFWMVIESDAKQREKVTGLVDLILGDEIVKTGIGLLAMGASPLLGMLPGMFSKVSGLIKRNGDDLFASGYYSAQGPNYDMEEGQTVKHYGPYRNTYVEVTIRAELTKDVIKEEV